MVIMGRMKFLKWLWGIALCLNALLIAEKAVFYFTGYFIPNTRTGWVIGFTVLTLVVTLFHGVSQAERQRRKRHSRGLWRMGGLILFTLLYSSLGFIYWAIASVSTPGGALSISAVGKTATYPAPSEQRAVVFKEISTLSDGSFIYAYEQRGPFQRSALIRPEDETSTVAIASEWSATNDAIRGAFFEATQLELEWSTDESSLTWHLTPDSAVTYSGTVEFWR